MTGHTKEPWHYVIGQQTIAIFFGEFLIAEINGDDEAAEADARRIVDCVNALAGLNPAAVASLIEAATAARNRIFGLEASAIAEGETELAQKFEGWANELSSALTALRGAQ